MPESLQSLHTFGLAAQAGGIETLEELTTLETRLDQNGFSRDTDLILGGGSNVVFIDDVPGTVFLNRIRGRRVLSDDGNTVRIHLAAGENWHDSVRWTLKQGWCGLENLSLIPGLCGAAPMQNIGAYGVELSQVLDAVHVLDLCTGQFRQLPRQDCAFAYRDSRFKSADRGRFLITGIDLSLSYQPDLRLDYPGVRESLASMGIQQPNALQLSDAIIRLRRSKLPDPEFTGNAGSFFKNPVVSEARAETCRERWPDMPRHPTADGVKLSAAWLIEQVGLKGHRVGGVGVSEKHALVLVNLGDATGTDLLRLVDIIQTRLHDTFGLTLEPEPSLLGTDTTRAPG